MKKIFTAAAAALLVSGSAFADGEATYNAACVACHGTGAAGAPKTGDAAAWAPRIAQGIEALYAVALNGKPGTAMMAKGGNASISDDDTKAAVDYMVANSK